MAIDRLADIPLVVAEVSSNHLGSLERATKLIEAAAAAGVQMIKFQTFTADTMTLNVDHPDFKVAADHDLWGGSPLYSLYETAATPWAWHPELFRRARELGIVPFSTPFDASAVDFLESLNVPMYKIASLEIVDIPLIRYAARTHKPLVISTGTATLAEIDDAVEAATAGGCSDVTLLVCTSSYPASPHDAHLRRMETLGRRYQCHVGLSDHTEGLGTSIAAVALGATLIERHFTLRRSEGGHDAAFSLEPAELALLVREARAAFDSLGSPEWAPIDTENESKRLRRSLYVVTNVSQGDPITPENVRAIRPGYGLPPKALDQIMGTRFARNAKAGEPLSWDHIDV
mgnify:CR=1 FL=1